MRLRAAVDRFHTVYPLRRFAGTTSIALVAFGAVSVLASHGAAAQQAPVPFILGGACPGPGGVLDTLVTPFCNATAGWLSNGLTYAQRFFEILIGIELAWSAIVWAFQKEQLGELLAAYIIKMMGILFFFGVIMNAQSWLPAIMQSFAQLGGKVTGQAAPLDPDKILFIGINLCQQVFNFLPQPNFVTSVNIFIPGAIGGAIQTDLTVCFVMLVAVIFAVIVCFLLFISFLMIAGQLIMTLIEMYIMIGAGAVMLGFTGSRWTMSFGEKYIGYSLSIGVKLFVTYVILALGVNLFPLVNCQPGDSTGMCGLLNAVAQTNTQNINGLGGLVLADLQIGATAVIFMMLAMRLPGLAASMMNGSPNLTLSAAIGAFQTAGGAIAGTVGAITNTAQTVVKEGGMAVVDAAMLGAGSAGSAAGGAGGGSAAGGASGGGAASGASGGGDVASAMGGEGSAPGGGGGSGGGNPLGDATGAAKNIPILGHLGAAALAPITGTLEAASSALSPLLKMDEGGGGGSVAVGLKLGE